MNENAKKWVAALRSGKYKQCKSVLKNTYKGEDSYCCLGVACDLYQQEVKDLYVKPPEGPFTVTYFDNCTAHLPSKVIDWLGLQSITGYYLEDGTKSCNLAELNDSRQYNFNQIADVIESEPPHLFIAEE
jgi:hypothetical protein